MKMKSNILSSILGCLLIVLTADLSTTVDDLPGTVSGAAGTIKADLLTVKPARPISVAVYHGINPKRFIIEHAKLGYIVRTTSANSSGTLVTMEKYE